MEREERGKSKALAAVLAFFLGTTGAHRYYLERSMSGAVQTIGFACIFIASFVITTIGRQSFMQTGVLSVVMAGLLLLYGGFVEIWALVDFVRILTGDLKPAEGLVYSKN